MTIPQQIETETLTPIWESAVETMQAIVPFFQEKTTAAMRQAPAHWAFILIAAANDPRPLTVDQLQAIYPYTARPAIVDALQPLLEGGFLQRSGGGNGTGAKDGYRATAKGRELIDGFFGAAHEALKDVHPLPQTDLQRLRDLLWTIVDNARSPLPVDESIFHAGRSSDPGEDGSLLAHIDQSITDLYYFRDDAHIAAWRPTGLDGSAWEALTFIWRDEAHSAAEVFEKRPNRGHAVEAYAAAIDDLVERGLLRSDGERVELSDEGRRLREEAEARTDEIFFGPWQVLDAVQIEELTGLLQKALDSLRHGARTRMWPLINDVAGAMQPLVREDVLAVMDEKLETRAYFNQMRMAREAEPQPYTVQRFLTRFPYANPQRATGLLQQAIEAGYMTQDGDEYALTEKGRHAVDAINDVFYKALGKIEVLPDDQMERLVTFLHTLVEAAANAGAPSTACLQQTYHSARPRDYAPLAQVDLHIDDLNAFRDDAHTTAWAAQFAGGRDWETLTRVWRDQAHSAAELAEQLPFRGWDEAAYQKSLETLVQRGWLEAQDGGYAITEKGRTLRQRVEEDTDELFYASWDQALSPQEQNELRTLLIRLKVQLETLHAEREQAGAAV